MQMCPKAIFVDDLHGNTEIHVRSYQVSPPFIVWFASLTNEEVVIE